MSNKRECTFKVDGTFGILKLQLPRACASRVSNPVRLRGELIGDEDIWSPML